MLTSGVLPFPAERGGAVEMRLSFYVDYNEKYVKDEITIYSVKPMKKMGVSTQYTHYYYVDTTSLLSKIKSKWYSFMRKKNENKYYHEKIEYFFSECLKDIKKKQYDFIFLHNRPGYALRLNGITRARIVAHLGNDYICPDIPMAKEIKTYCDAIWTCSDFIRKRVDMVKTTKNVPVTTIHNAIDVGRFVNAQPKSRKDLGFTDEDFVIVYNGRLTEYKGVIEIIQSLQILAERYHNIKLLIIGASFYGRDKEDTPFIKRLKEYAKGLEQRILFTGFVDYAEMPSYLKMADIAILPSMWEEPFGLTIVEAMASGLPLITTKSGGIPEICHDVAIILEREQIIPSIVKAIQYLYSSPQECNRLSSLARERAWSFDKSVYCKNIEVEMGKL